MCNIAHSYIWHQAFKWVTRLTRKYLSRVHLQQSAGQGMYVLGCLHVCVCVYILLIFVCMRMCMFVYMYVYVHNHSHILMCHKPSCNNAHSATLPAQCIVTSQFHLTWCVWTHAKEREKLCECECVCVRARINRKRVKDSNPGSVLRRLNTTWCVCARMHERVSVCKSVCVRVHERESVLVCGWERKRKGESVCQHARTR